MGNYFLKNQLSVAKHMHTLIDKKLVSESVQDIENKRKRSRITKKSEVTVHQWTFSTEVK